MSFDPVSYLMGKASGGGGGSTNVLSGKTTPTSAQGRNGDVYLQYYDNPLPSEYTLLEKIVASGGQYIQTGVPAKQQLMIDADFKWTNTSDSSDSTLLGGTGTTTSVIYLGVNPTSQYRGYYFNWTGSFLDIRGRNYKGRNRVIVSLRSGDIQITDNDATVYTASTTLSGTTGANNLTIFARNGSSAFFGGELYHLKIYDLTDNDTLIRDFIPAKRNSDDEIGLYDLVNDEFYTNSGSGSFTGTAYSGGHPITAAYAKVSGAWQDLIGTDINDIDLGT